MSQQHRSGGGPAPDPSSRLSLEDLAMMVSDGEIEGELQDRVAAVIRSDPRFADQFVELEALAAKAQTTDLWEGLGRRFLSR